MLTKEDVKLLTAEFPEDKLGVKVQSVSKNKDKAMLILYLQHTDVADRLDSVDPTWSFTVLTEGFKEIPGWGEALEKIYFVTARVTLGGVSRENVGEGSEPKGAYSDALKRCAMLFGIGRFLYDGEVVWANYNPEKDRYKEWTIEEYRSLCRRKPTVKTEPKAPIPKPTEGLFKEANTTPGPAERERLTALANAKNWTPKEVVNVMMVKYKKDKVDQLTWDEYRDVSHVVGNRTYLDYMG